MLTMHMVSIIIRLLYNKCHAKHITADSFLALALCQWQKIIIMKG